jgi:hypothetical protein
LELRQFQKNQQLKLYSRSREAEAVVVRLQDLVCLQEKQSVLM